MTTMELAVEIEDFVKNHATSKQDSIKIERDMASILAKREFDRNLAMAEEDIEAGRCTTINDKTTKEFMDGLAKKLLPHQS